LLRRRGSASARRKRSTLQSFQLSPPSVANAGHVSLDQLKVMSAIERCRTAALGGHVEPPTSPIRTRPSSTIC
jgi:hypothetical protein